MSECKVFFQFLHSPGCLRSPPAAPERWEEMPGSVSDKLQIPKARGFFHSIVAWAMRDAGCEMIWVQPCKLLGMAHLLVAVPMRISISYLQATVHLINRWISGLCCGTVNVCSSRSVYIGVCKASESTAAGLSALAPREHTSTHFCL